MLRENEAKIYPVLSRLKALAKPEFAWWLLAAGAVILRLRQYVARVAFGNDEAALALDIITHPFSALGRPFADHQSAPILFLYIQKAFIQLFGTQDFVFEIFPFLLGLLAVYLFYRIAREHFGTQGLIAAFAFAISYSLVFYPSNPKQYAGDATLALLLVYLAARCLGEHARARDFAMLGLGGALAIWLSHPAVFVLAGIGLSLAIELWVRKAYRLLAWCVAAGAAWVLSFGIEYLVSLRQMTADPYLTKYWQSAFMPLPPWKDPRWFVDAYTALMSVSLRTDATFIGIVCLILLLIGGAALLARKRTLALFILLPFVIALAASALQKYPLQYRFMVFLVPFVYLLLAEGLGYIYRVLARGSRVLALVSCAVLFLIVLWPGILTAKRNFLKPERLWDMRAAVNYLRENWQEGDTVFVSGGGQTFAYYALSEGLKTGYTMIDTSHRIIRYGVFMEDLEALAGRDRVWIIFAHFEKGGDYTRYDSYIGKHAAVLDTFETGYVRVYLCDLTR